MYVAHISYLPCVPYIVYSTYGNVNLIVGFPSGPQPGNRASVRSKKKTGPEKQTADARKNKYHLSTELASVWPEKNKCPKEKKGGSWAARAGKSLLGKPGRLFSSRQAAHPGSAQGIVRPSVRKKETGPEKQAADARKKQIRICFFQASVGRQTSNQIHVPLCRQPARPLPCQARPGT